MKRELEAADIRAAYDAFAMLTVSFINKMDEEFLPTLFAIHLGEEPGQINEMVPFPSELVLLLQSDANGLIPLVRRLLAGSSEVEAADLVVHITESWVVNGSDGGFDRDVLEGCVEALMLAVHTPEGTFLGTCPIETNDGKRRAVFHPIDLSGIVLGRLAMSPENPVKH